MTVSCRLFLTRIFNGFIKFWCKGSKKKRYPPERQVLTKENETKRKRNENSFLKKRKKTKQNESAICYARFGKRAHQKLNHNVHPAVYTTR